jgi:hypothetical protein
MKIGQSAMICGEKVNVDGANASEIKVFYFLCRKLNDPKGFEMKASK